MSYLWTGKTLTPEQRLPKSAVAILKRAHAIAGVLMIGERSVDRTGKIPTACTNGKDEWYGAEFVDSINDAQLRFVVFHEVYHKMFRDPITYYHLSKICHATANIALDYVRNILIWDEFGKEKNDDGTPWLEMPDGICFDEKYRGWEPTQVFWDIYKPEDGNGPSSPDDGNGPSSPDDGTGGQAQPDTPTGFDDIDFEGAAELSDQDKADLEREIDEAIRQGALVAGKTGSGGLRSVGELLEPQVNWRDELREFTQATCTGDDYSTYARPNRRYLQHDMYMPSGVSETVGELVLACDTSGSIREALSVFLGEVQSICDLVRPERVRLLYWDTKVCREEVYEQHELEGLAKSTQPSGGGGTDVSCVTNYLTEKSINAQACIVFTDGHIWGGWSTWNIPVLWCIYGNKGAKPDVGKAVHIKQGDL